MVREELTMARLDTTGVDGVVEVTGVAATGGKTAPLGRGSGKVGLTAFPKTLPSPGKVATGAAALAAW